MKDTTEAWLKPMLVEAQKRHDTGEFILRLATAALVPAGTPESPSRDLTPQRDGDDNPTGNAIDWVRFGRLLRDELGLWNYPVSPP